MIDRETLYRACAFVEVPLYQVDLIADYYDADVAGVADRMTIARANGDCWRCGHPLHDRRKCNVETEREGQTIYIPPHRCACGTVDQIAAAMGV